MKINLISLRNYKFIDGVVKSIFLLLTIIIIIDTKAYIGKYIHLWMRATQSLIVEDIYILKNVIFFKIWKNLKTKQ